MWVQLIAGLAKPFADLIDNLHTSDAEKLEAHRKMNELVLNAEQKAQKLELSFEEQITERHKADMTSDSMLSKNIRPFVIIFLSAVFVVITFFDGNVGDFQVKESYTGIYEILLMTVYGFYFSSRALEKTTKIYKAMKGTPK